jgi:hypothetical protein
MCVCRCVCVFMYIYVYIYINTHTYIYTYITYLHTSTHTHTTHAQERCNVCYRLVKTIPHSVTYIHTHTHTHTHTLTLIPPPPPASCGTTHTKAPAAACAQAPCFVMRFPHTTKFTRVEHPPRSPMSWSLACIPVWFPDMSPPPPETINKAWEKQSTRVQHACISVSGSMSVRWQ